ncbi:MAG: type II/IV secretion system protein [Chloroflexi bacterium]|nr:type II/IV secretion system protein [Chloroflexota bacterium]
MLAQKQMDQVTDSFIERLAFQGYSVTPSASVQGRSGIERAFDYLVQRQYGLITYVIAIDVITNAEDPEVSLQRLFAFEDKCLDCNMEHRAIIAVPHLSSVAGQFAQKDGVKVFDNTAMRAFLDRPAVARETAAEIPSEFKEKSDVIAALRHAGYQVVEGANLTGVSGTSHVFEAIAFLDDGFLMSRIGIDHAGGESVDLGQVSLFDVKCNDTGIREKILLVSERPTAAAREFAEEHKIRLIGLHDGVAPVEVVPEAEPKAFTMRSVVDQLLVVRSKPKREEKPEKKRKPRGGTAIGSPEADTVAESTAHFEEAAPLPEMVVREAVTAAAEAPPVVEDQSPPVAETVAPSAEAVAEAAPAAPEAKKVRVVREPPKPVVEEVVEKPKVKLRKAARPEALRMVPENTARRFSVTPIDVEDNSLVVAMVNPSDIGTIQVLEHQTKMRVKAVAAEKAEILEAIDFNYKKFGQIAEQISRIDTGIEAAAGGQDLVAATANAPVASALNLVIEEAVKARASDIHIEPEEKRLRIRYRIDGVLHEVMSLPIKIHPPLTSRVKVMSDLNIADHIRPQDGQFSVEVKGKGIDVRVATSPTVHGEAVVMRLLDKSVAVLDLPQLGFSGDSLKKYQNMLAVPFGMILISGPTGAGKTTTLYASVNTLDKVTGNIITVEDPVEYRFENIKQIQVNPKAGVTFAGTLRSMMRLDPDVILVGEIRDGETATIAVKAALTGHLVLSSIHANDAIGVVYRLLDLGIEPFLVSTVVTGTVSQRMARRICLNCAAEVEPSESERLAFQKATGEELVSYLSGSGCDLCSFTGYRGRLGLFEILVMSEKTRSLIAKGASSAEVKEAAVEEGMVTLLKDGMLKVKQGLTTVAEVLRNAYSLE